MGFLADRVIGLLLGLAVGDRNRGPTAMALHLAESLLERNGYDADDIGARYLQWWREGAYDTGPTAAGVLSLVNAGQTWEQAARNADHALGGPAGCNPAHRCAPLAICHQIMDSELSEVAFREARLTHLHPLSGDVAAAMSCLCRELVKGVSWPNALALAAQDRLEATQRALRTGTPEKLSRSGFAPDVLHAAIHFVDTSTTLPLALTRSIAFAGPANYCPVLAGAIAGARWGCAGISEADLQHHGNLLSRLRSIALEFAERI
ncbi:ADP-ribosylglycohydrolase [Desulfonatronum zhilinae]|nr:ADP-ribosylglycohydrolase [Desulfonatronum zhilinae]